MDIGKMRSQVTIYAIEQTMDDYGGLNTIINAPLIGQFWAEVKDTGSSSNYSHSKQLTVYDYKITIRDSNDYIITTACYVVFNNKKLKIEGIERKDEGYKRFLILRCSKIGK